MGKVQHTNALAAAVGAVTAGGGVPGVVTPRFGLGHRGCGLGNGLRGGGVGEENVHGITSTELSHMSTWELQQLYRNCSTPPPAAGDTMSMSHRQIPQLYRDFSTLPSAADTMSMMGP